MDRFSILKSAQFGKFEFQGETSRFQIVLATSDSATFCATIHAAGKAAIISTVMSAIEATN
jgi:hypothetical protein